MKNKNCFTSFDENEYDDKDLKMCKCGEPVVNGFFHACQLLYNVDEYIDKYYNDEDKNIV